MRERANVIPRAKRLNMAVGPQRVPGARQGPNGAAEDGPHRARS